MCCKLNPITSRPFKIKLFNGTATRYIVNAIPGLSRFLWRAGQYKNFRLVKKASLLLFNTERLTDFVPSQKNTWPQFYYLDWLNVFIKCFKKIYTEGKLNHCLKNTATLRSLIGGQKMSVGVFPFILQLSLSLCNGKVQKLFESFQCLQIQAARNDVTRLYDWMCNSVVFFSIKR